MRELLAITRALDNEHRLRILMSLRAGEVCLCHLAELLGLAPSTISRHVDLLRQAGLVKVRKDGRWHHYRLAGRGSSPEVRAAIRWISRALADGAEISADLARLESIRTAIPEEMNACVPGN